MLAFKMSRLAKPKPGMRALPPPRCCQIAMPSTAASSDPDAGAAWKELLRRVKEAIVASFDLNFTVYEEDVRRVGGNRHLPGWNFCTFFIQKVRSRGRVARDSKHLAARPYYDFGIRSEPLLLFPCAHRKVSRIPLRR